MIRLALCGVQPHEGSIESSRGSAATGQATYGDNAGVAGGVLADQRPSSSAFDLDPGRVEENEASSG
jgi:hypothetical protein